MLVIFVVLILLSAFFSGLETAFFNLKSYNGVNKTVKRLLENPKHLLASLLTGNTIANIGLGSIAASYTLILYNKGESFQTLNLSTLLFLEVITVTIIILIFGEIIPKTYAIAKSETLANTSAKVLDLVLKIIYPIAKTNTVQLDNASQLSFLLKKKADDIIINSTENNITIQLSIEQENYANNIEDMRKKMVA